MQKQQQQCTPTPSRYTPERYAVAPVWANGGEPAFLDRVLMCRDSARASEESPKTTCRLDLHVAAGENAFGLSSTLTLKDSHRTFVKALRPLGIE